jgi:hypothetical protein
MDSNRLKKPTAVKVQYKERAKNGGKVAKATTSNNSKAVKITAKYKGGGSMGRCKGGC